MERTAERHREHYCWVKIVAPAEHSEGAGTRLPPSLRRAFDSTHLLKKMADGDGPPPGGERPPPVPPPPISPSSPPPPPPPPGIARAELAPGIRRGPQAWRIERGSKLSGDFGMEVAGVSGDRMAAWEWIESEDGRRWREGAVGLDLVLFSPPHDQ